MRAHRGVICDEASKRGDVVANRRLATAENETEPPDHTPMRTPTQQTLDTCTQQHQRPASARQDANGAHWMMTIMK